MIGDWFSIVADPEARIVHLFLRDDIGIAGKTSGQLAAELNAIASPFRLEVRIDSRGGDARAALNIAEILRRFDAHAFIDGRAYSAGLIAAMGCRTITANPTARLLVHSPAGYAFGSAEELFNKACVVEKLCSYVKHLFKERTEQPIEVVSSWLAADTYFSAQEALAAGIVDFIAAPAPARNTESLAVLSDNFSIAASKTESHKLFADWINAFGTVEVEDKAAFTREISEWLQTRVKETKRKEIHEKAHL